MGGLARSAFRAGRMGAKAARRRGGKIAKKMKPGPRAKKISKFASKAGGKMDTALDRIQSIGEGVQTMGEIYDTVRHIGGYDDVDVDDNDDDYNDYDDGEEEYDYDDYDDDDDDGDYADEVDSYSDSVVGEDVYFDRRRPSATATGGGGGGGGKKVCAKKVRIAVPKKKKKEYVSDNFDKL